ncbi:MAG: ABC transporter ATP-binding protein [Acidaminococcales bacterium]|jgi:spermidine/putrescine transport system ATP-binding protein|nr:ABC transporter ATP-binding protein [Acidaminococcales bacterium]
MISIRGLQKKFDDTVVIPHLDLTINNGEFLTLLGPSGCGKTTLLRMLAGLETPTQGEIYIDSRNVTKLPPYKRNVNMIFQHYALFPHMTVEENIRFGLNMKRVPAAEQKKLVDQVVYLTQLDEFRARRPQQLSGGQQQRVAIARALVNSPKVLLLDEPLGALDYQLRKNLQLELKNLQKGLGITFVYVTHDQEEALTMSDRIVVMNKGAVEQDSSPDTLYHRPESTFVATFIGEVNIFESASGKIAMRPEKINLAEAGAALPCCPPEAGPCPAPRYFGTIVDVVFYGTIDKIFILIDNSRQIVTAYQYFDDKRKWRAEERVGLWWRPQDEVRLQR